jgi:hypothetical protein
LPGHLLGAKRSGAEAALLATVIIGQLMASTGNGRDRDHPQISHQPIIFSSQSQIDRKTAKPDATRYQRPAITTLRSCDSRGKIDDAQDVAFRHDIFGNGRHGYFCRMSIIS